MEKTKGLTSRQKRAMESRKRLIDAAVDLFNEFGYHGTSVQDVCRRADLSVGVFYHYFPSKQAILDTVERQKYSALMGIIGEKSHSKNHMEAILELFQFLAQQQATGSFELLCIALAPQPTPDKHGDHDLEEFVVSIVRSGQEGGEFTTSLPAQVIAADLMISARGYLFHWCEEGGCFDFQVAQQEYLRRILRAYAGPAAVL